MLRKLKCFLYGHDMQMIEKFGIVSYKFCCLKCGKLFAYNSDHDGYLPLDNSWEDFSRLRKDIEKRTGV